MAKVRNEIDALTSLRFFAAAGVVAFHQLGFPYGAVGVSFFFVLSGFVLSINYNGRLSTKSERREFLLRRFARIYPLHLLTMLAAFVFAVWSVRIGTITPRYLVGVTVAHLFLVQSFVPVAAVYYGLNIVAWSISTEAFFYVSLPTLLRFLRVSARAKIVAWGFSALVFGVAWAITHTAHGENDAWMLFVNPVYRLFEFALGCTLGLAYTVAEKPVSSGPGRLALATACCAIMVVFTGHFGETLSLPGIIIAPFFGWLIWECTFNAPRWLSAPILITLGNASYALYMIHVLVGRYMSVVIRASWAEPLAAFISVALSVLVWRYFEKPAQALVLRWFDARKQTATATF